MSLTVKKHLQPEHRKNHGGLAARPWQELRRNSGLDQQLNAIWLSAPVRTKTSVTKPLSNNLSQRVLPFTLLPFVWQSIITTVSFAMVVMTGAEVEGCVCSRRPALARTTPKGAVPDTAEPQMGATKLLVPVLTKASGA